MLNALFARSRTLLRLFSLVIVMGAAVLPAYADKAAATVNGTVILADDASQRGRIAEVFDKRSVSTREALDLAIDDLLKLQKAARLGVRVPDSAAEEPLGRLATANGGRANLLAGLKQAGISQKAMISKLKADIAWEFVLRAEARRINRLRNAEITAAIRSEAEDGKIAVTDYVLQSIVFIVPAGGGDGTKQMAKARAARQTFAGCSAGTAALRGTVDVAVKAPFSRSSDDLPEATAKLLAATATGRLTEPFATGEGIEMLAVCSRRTRQDIGAARERIDRTATDKALEARAKALLADLRRTAVIEYRR